MRVHFLLLGLFGTLEVLALDSAAPWEMMYFYAAYKAEWLSGMDGTARQIATECVRSNRGASLGSDFDMMAAAAGVPLMCSFDDFVLHVGTKHTFSEYRYTLAGDTWDVDKVWPQIRDKFAQMGLPGTAPKDRYQFSFQKLLPKVDFGNVERIPYPPVIAQIGNALQAAREFEIHQRGLPLRAVIAAQIFLSGEYSRIALQFRTQDAVTYPARVVRNYIRGDGAGLFRFVSKGSVTILPPANFDGTAREAGTLSAYDSEVDFDATLTSMGATTRQKNAFRRYYAKNYNLDDSTVIDHQNVIGGYKRVVDFISLGDKKLGCRLPSNGAAPQKRNLISWEENGPEETESSGRNYQSHLVPVDINFEKMDMQSFGNLISLGVVSV